MADLAALLVCTAVWGTTWYAITLQFGVVDPLVSVVYRFALAALVLFGWARASGQSLRLSQAQHAAAAGMGVATFALQYPLVYLAEGRLASAVVAVLFAALSFVNLALFRIVFGERARPLAWLAACMGVAGVAILSWSELAATQMDAGARTGLALALGGVAVSAVGNLFARGAQGAGASVVASTGWAMFYGAGALALAASALGTHWSFDARPAYIASLLYLAVFGSVVAFLLYYTLARRRGFGAASYISALTPPVAMVVSSVFEGKHWTALALAGVGVIAAGQWMLLRASRPAPPGTPSIVLKQKS